MPKRRPAKQVRPGWAARKSLEQSWLAVLLGAGTALSPLALDPRGFDSFALPHLLALSATAATLGLCLVVRGFALPSGSVARTILAAAAVAAICSILGAQDRNTALLGNEGYRHGLVSVVALSAVALAAFSIAHDERASRLALSISAVGLLFSALYALVQWWGVDPVDWSAPSRSVFSTAGNQNDLASYSVVSIALAGPFLLMRSRVAIGAGAGVLALCCAQVVLSDSRAGLIALAVAVGMWLATAFLFGDSIARKRSLLVVACALIVCVPNSLFVGGESAPVAYVQAATNSGDDTHGSGISARFDLWGTSFDVFRAHPIFGVGPGGLYSEFPRHQRQGLGFPFDRPTGSGNDPLVASPHNAILEVAVTAGLFGLLTLGVVAVWVAVVLFQALRSGWQLGPAVAAGLGGFTVMAMLNPLPLGAVMVFVAMAAMAAGRGAVTWVAPPQSAVFRGIVFAAAVLPLLAGLSLTVLATLASGETAAAIEASADLRDEDASNHARQAASLAPFEAAVRRIETGALWNEFVTSGDRNDLEAALGQVEQLLNDFPGLASDYLRLARFRYALGKPGVDEAIAEARQVSPHGQETAAWILSFPREPVGE